MWQYVVSRSRERLSRAVEPWAKLGFQTPTLVYRQERHSRSKSSSVRLLSPAERRRTKSLIENGLVVLLILSQPGKGSNGRCSLTPVTGRQLPLLCTMQGPSRRLFSLRPRKRWRPFPLPMKTEMSGWCDRCSNCDSSRLGSHPWRSFWALNGRLNVHTRHLLSITQCSPWANRRSEKRSLLRRKLEQSMGGVDRPEWSGNHKWPTD